MSENDPNTLPTSATAEEEPLYPCVGICMADPESGLCQGCGRPLAEPQSPETDDHA